MATLDTAVWSGTPKQQSGRWGVRYVWSRICVESALHKPHPPLDCFLLGKDLGTSIHWPHTT